MTDLSPFALAARQISLDRAATAEIPVLFERKKQRLLSSPHAFLRGSAPLFYEVLAAQPELAAGPDGEGWIVGDAHIENVGAYRNDADDVVFDLNDFDDTTIGPWRLDALRLTTSVLLAGRGAGMIAGAAIELGMTLLDAYAAAACRPGAVAAPPEPRAVHRLVETTRARSKADLLDARCPVRHKNGRQFARGDRYIDLPGVVGARVPDLLRAYVEALGDRAPGKAKGWELEDSAQRIAGNGSLGCLRIASVVKSPNGDERIVEFKQASDSSVHVFLGAAPDAAAGAPSDRVVAGARAMTKSPPRLLASVPTTALGRSFIGRTLAPQEDKLDMLRVQSELTDIVRTVGHLVGSAHARAATRPPSSPWSAADLAGLLDNAAVFAGLYESVYLAYARLSEGRPAWIARRGSAP